MKVGDAIATILKQEGVEYIIGYPVNHILEHVAKFDIRPIIVRQERIGLHMADAVSRVTSGKTIGVFAMQHGPGTENAYGGVAQAYSESIPILVLPMGYQRRLAWVERNYNASVSMRSITKTAEPITSAKEIPNVFRRAFQNLKSGRGGPVLVEIPADLWAEEVDPKDYAPPQRIRTGTDLSAVAEAAKMLVAAKRPVIYAGQGVHWAEAWTELKELAELLAIPVTTSLEGKSAFPETHPLSLGSGGLAIPQAVRTFLDKSDLIFGIGCSFTETNFGVKMPAGAKIIQATLDPGDINKDVPVALGIAGDAKIVLEAMLAEVRKIHGGKAKDAQEGRQGDRGHERAVARQVDAEAHEQRRAAQSLPRALGSPEDRRHRQHHHHARCRQPARSALAVLETDNAALLHRLGQDHPARRGPRLRDGRQARQARQALHQRVGRCRDRLHGHGLRDRGARAHPDPVDPAQQLLDGDRAQGDAGLDREVPRRPTSPATTRPWRARSAATASGSRSRATSLPRSSAASLRRRRAKPPCSSSSRRRKSKCRGFSLPRSATPSATAAAGLPLGWRVSPRRPSTATLLPLLPVRTGRRSG